MSIYRPLLVSQSEIRILVLEDSTDPAAALRCQLEYSSLNETPSYQALSYCWGGTAQTESISISGRELGVTTNLYQALLALRAKGIERVWADAVCINQDDLEERSQQVHRMNAIYLSADKVIAWLGYSRPMVDPEIRVIAEKAAATSDWLARHAKFYRPSITKKGDLFMGFMVSRQRKEMRLKHDKAAKILSFLGKDNWSALNELVQNKYWTRVWVIQEFAMARKLEIVWNNQKVSVSTLVSALEGLKQSRRYISRAEMVDANSCRHIMQLCAFRENQQRIRPIRLLRALEMSRRAESTDERDRLFGILGMTFDGLTVMPSPSYALSVENTARQATLTLVQSTHTLDYIFVRDSPSSSWVIDWFNGWTWSNKRLISYLLRESSFFRTKSRVVSSSWLAAKRREMYLRKSGLQLVVRGNFIGTICNCTTPVHSNDQFSRFVDSQKANETIKSVSWQTDSYVAEAIFFCIGMITKQDDWDKEEYCFFEQFRDLLVAREKLPLGKYDKLFLRWLEKAKNGELQVSQHETLEELLRNEGQMNSRPTVVKRYDWVKVAWRSLQVGLRLCVVDTGHIGWVTRHARAGDKIAIIHGCTVPVVLRPVRGSSNYQVIGDSCIYGLMEGEGLSSTSEEIFLQ